MLKHDLRKITEERLGREMISTTDDVYYTSDHDDNFTPNSENPFLSPPEIKRTLRRLRRTHTRKNLDTELHVAVGKPGHDGKEEASKKVRRT